MKTVFNKTLLASAVLAFAGLANAATITPAGFGAPVAAPAAAYTASAEGFKFEEMMTIGAGVGNLQVGLTTQVTNVEQDVLVVTFSGATIITTGANASVPVLPGYDFFDFQGNNTIRFRVQTGGVASGQTNQLSGVKLNVTGVAAGASISIATKILSLNPVIGEYDAGSRVLFSVKNQVTAAVSPALDATVSTQASRKTFVGGGSDVLGITLTDNTGYAFALPTDENAEAEVTHVVEGNFGFLRDADKTAFGGNNNGTLTSAEIAAYVAKGGVASGTADTFTFALNADNSKLTVTQVAKDALDLGVTLTITPPAQGKTAAVAATATALQAGAFKANVSLTTEDSDFAVATGASAGAWSLDGSVVKVPYLVLQDGRFGTVVTVSNSGSRTGEILLDIVDEAGVSIASGLNAGSSTPGSIVNVSGKIRDALIAKGKDLKVVNKFSVVVTTNVPENDVLVYSAYTDSQNGGERAIVNNDSKVQVKGIVFPN